MVDFPVHNQSPADAAARMCIKNRVLSPARTALRLAECGDVRVVFHDDRKSGQSPKPLPERKIVPAGDVVRTADPSRGRINRSSVTDADGLPLELRLKPLDDALDVITNTLCPKGSIYGQLLTIHNSAVACARDQLKLAAADLYAEEVHIVDSGV